MSADTIISIIAGGWSVRQIDLSKVPGTIIGVNDSAIHARCDLIVSMDRLWTEYRFPQLRELRRPTWLRRSAVQNVEKKFPWLKIFECDHESTEFTDAPDMLNGTNSGFCAFNLAYQLRPATILLFGFDMKRGPNAEAYWFEPYPWVNNGGATSSRKYADWSKQFAAAARACKAAGIAVKVVGDSAIEAFDRLPVSEFGRRDVA